VLHVGEGVAETVVGWDVELEATGPGAVGEAVAAPDGEHADRVKHMTRAAMSAGVGAIADLPSVTLPKPNSTTIGTLLARIFPKIQEFSVGRSSETG
jgi:hypothetical protein